jgi:hypothetical protein
VNSWKLDSLWMWLLGLVAAAVLGGAVLDFGTTWAKGAARVAAGAASADSRAQARPTRTAAFACAM